MDAITRFYLGCALFGGVIFIARSVMLLMGLDSSDAGGDFGDVGDAGGADFDSGHGGDLHGDGAVHADGDHSTETVGADLRLLTIQGFTAFVMMFGLTGYAVHTGTTWSILWGVILSVAVGLFAMWLVAFLFSLMRRLESSGSIGFVRAIGEEGTVYLRIPVEGVGKVQVKIGENLRVVDAMTDGGVELPSGERVFVSHVTDDQILVVHRAKPYTE